MITNKFKNSNRNSFTLIELLVVLALVAILSVVVVMTLNPAELIKQARDSNRLSDLATINTALNLFSADVTAGFMGTSTIIYVSIPSTQQNCSDLGLPLLATSSYTYNCVTAANLRNTNGTGWIPVNLQRISSNSPISQLPIDPINTTTTLNYYTYMSGGSWKLSAISLESQKYIVEGNKDGGIASGSFEIGNDMNLGAGIFPNGWVKVPGNSTFGTSDFWVMKYEAKCASLTAPGVGLTSPDTGSQTYDNSTTTPITGACSGDNARTITSVPDGYPIANISRAVAGVNNDAIEYCQAIGSHLITNAEWQTIAWNAQNVDANWSGGSVGSGYVGRGNTNNTRASVASADDTNSTYDTGYTDFTHRRAHILSNGQSIWDLAGNVWEWNSDTIIGTNEPYSAVAGWQWREFTAITNWGTLGQQATGPANSAWNTTQGVGKIYSADGSANANGFGFVRGGRWNESTNGGIEMLHLYYGPTSKYTSLGFRCVR